MAQRKRTYSPERSKRRSRQVQDSTLGTHVSHAPSRRRPSSRQASHVRGNHHTYAEGVARKANVRRVVFAIVAIVAVAALAIGAGILAFRGTVGSEMSLRDSDARNALVSAKAGEPTYLLATVELGAVAEPLDNGGPDMFLLVRFDSDKRRLALVNFPPMLQITSDNRSDSLSDVAQKGDVKLIEAVSTFAKVDISHFLKLEEGDLAGLVDALGGIEVDVDQVIDDPHAGNVYLDSGTQVLDGEAALAYLRAINLKRGEEDRIDHQLNFAVLVFEKLFGGEGSFAARLEAIGSYVQTDCSYDDFKAAQTWIAGLRASDIVSENLPGYFTEVTDVTGTNSGRYVGSSQDLVQLLEDIANGKTSAPASGSEASAALPSSFTVEVQNGTDVTGAASVTADQLAKAGFTVVQVGNAEQPVYNETLVVYKGDQGLARANAVISELGAGRAVEGGVYYSFNADVLVIIGGDFKPVS